MVNPQQDTYSVKVYCSSCGYEGEVEIKKGKRVAAKMCPSCGEKSLKRDEPQAGSDSPSTTEGYY